MRIGLRLSCLEDARDVFHQNAVDGRRAVLSGDRIAMDVHARGGAFVQPQFQEQRVPRRAVPNGVPDAARPHLRDGYCLRRPSRPPSTRSSDLRAVASASLRDDSTACSGCLAGHLRTQ